MAPPPSPPAVDPRSGFCKSNSTFYSKRKPVPLPPNDSLDVTTFISSQAHRGHIAFIDAATGRHLTYSQLWRAVDSVASSLSDMGIKKGHVILILSPNSISFPVVCLAIMSLGAIITTTNPLNTTREITKQIADSKPVLAFTTRELLPKLAGFASNNIVLMDSADQQTKNKSNSNKKVPTLAAMMNRPPTSGRFRETVSQNDTATLLYSSGTTGASKGVVSSHRNLIATVRTVLGRFFSQAEEEQMQTFLCTVPMFHIYGLATFATGFLTSGSTIVILSKFDMHDMLSAIGKYRVTYLPLVPPILVALVNGAAEIKAKYDLSSLRSALSGGAPLSKEVIEGFLEKFPTVSISQGSILMYAATILGELPRLRAVLTGSNENWVSVKGYYPRTSKTLKKKKKKSISQGYGLTETTGVGASTDTLEESRRYGTAGMLSPSMEAKIVDPDSGEALTVNKTGELWLKGPTIMKGYFCNDDATASTLDSEGWLRTGDLCYIDDDGFIFVVDRLKELIKYKAFQVPPAELESLLLTHPQIADAAVIPFPDEKVGQFPMAYVVRKAGSNLSETAVMDFIAKQVAPYKRIRKVAFIASVPKNPSGKILRKDLIQLATKSPKL